MKRMKKIILVSLCSIVIPFGQMLFAAAAEKVTMTVKAKATFDKSIASAQKILDQSKQKEQEFTALKGQLSGLMATRDNIILSKHQDEESKNVLQNKFAWLQQQEAKLNILKTELETAIKNMPKGFTEDEIDVVVDNLVDSEAAVAAITAGTFTEDAWNVQVGEFGAAIKAALAGHTSKKEAIAAAIQAVEGVRDALSDFKPAVVAYLRTILTN